MIYDLTIGGQTKRSKLGAHQVQIDWDKVPETAQQFIIKYGLRQYIADGMAGAESEADAKAGVADRTRKVLEADFARTKGEPGFAKADTEETRAVKLAKQFIRDSLKAQNATAPKEAIDEAARALVESDPVYKKEAKKQLKAEADSKEAASTSSEGNSIIAGLLASVAGVK